MLTSLGFSVLTAANGVEAITVAEASDKSIDALLADVVMPELGGPGLVDRLASRGIRPAVIYMSGYEDRATLFRVLNSPDIPLLHKPFTMHSLVLVLREALDKRAG
jgi:two-component system cell cycle sensor histidine kinase/response regulator CckA